MSYWLNLYNKKPRNEILLKKENRRGIFTIFAPL
jgi:hypothetical protein